MKKLIIISPQPWGKSFISKHHYAIEMSRRGTQVVFLAPYCGKKGTLRANIRVTQLNDPSRITLVEYSNPNWLLFFRFHLGRVYDLIVKRVFSETLASLGPFDWLWCFDGNTFRDFRFIAANRKLLFLADNTENSYLRALVLECGHLAAVSEAFLSPYRSLGIRCLLLHHGLADPFVKQSQLRMRELQERNTPHSKVIRRVGFVGNLLIANALDHKALMKTIFNRPDLEFVFWGPWTLNDSNLGGELTPAVANFISFVRSRPNVECRGPVSPNDLAKEIQSMDAFLLPYSGTEGSNSRLNSHKVMEYLSTGKVVIASRLDRYLAESPGLLAMAKSHHSPYEEWFDEVVSNAQYWNCLELMRLRISFACANSYETQCQRLLDFIEPARPIDTILDLVA